MGNVYNTMRDGFTTGYNNMKRGMGYNNNTYDTGMENFPGMGNTRNMFGTPQYRYNTPMGGKRGTKKSKKGGKRTKKRGKKRVGSKKRRKGGKK